MSDRNGAIIRVEHLTAGYEDAVVLNDLTFEVYRGEIFFILGGSGSGKSTLMKNMVGLYRPATGVVLIDERDIAAAEGDDRLDTLRLFGVMYQNGALFGSMTLLENIRLPLEEWTDLPSEAMEVIARMKLQLVGLTGFEHHMPSELSGGMQKRAALARAMALDPQILFLDEPTSGLDPVLSADLDRLILRLSKTLGITFVVVSHALSSIYSIADRVIMLDTDTKKIIAEGRPQELRGHSNEAVRNFLDPQSADQTG
ncbi:MAG: polyamine ABC transporter ATP-binding protein [Deltaproteobacteria bacterium HGW-Deltaproteobacteria-15]|jgi:phospholipid/cholesterol/gamma-HCH transport system ATP-binding protein|nr:MAG: polyamine ABC transporter ATP-binding protein [Deltaproteobacteria bacterium HGW-Deltaproteobacteria-15]